MRKHRPLDKKIHAAFDRLYMIMDRIKYSWAKGKCDDISYRRMKNEIKTIALEAGRLHDAAVETLELQKYLERERK